MGNFQTMTSTLTAKPPNRVRAHNMGMRGQKAAMERDYAALLDWLNQTKPETGLSGFYLPLPPNIANARLHWRSKAALKTRYFAMCDQMRFLQMLPLPFDIVPGQANVTLTAYLKGRMDTGNLFARVKWPEDWLVRNGYARDDTEQFWRYTGLPAQVAVSKHNIETPNCPCLFWSFRYE